jgi:hypothetical protein
MRGIPTLDLRRNHLVRPVSAPDDHVVRMRIPPKADILCRVDNRINVLKNIIEFGGLLLVFESKSGFALKCHLRDDPERSQGTYSSMEDVRLLNLGTIHLVSIGCNQCQIEYLLGRSWEELGSAFVMYLNGHKAAKQGAPFDRYRSTQG